MTEAAKNKVFSFRRRYSYLLRRVKEPEGQEA